MTEIVLHQFAGDTGVESGSPFCVKVHRALAFKGVPYQTRNVGAPGALKRLNPGVCKVPVIEAEGALIADSTAIIDWLEARHPEPALRPAEPRARALDRLIEDWADESLYWFAVYARWAIDTNFEPFARRAFAGLPPVVRRLVPRMARKQALGMLHGHGLGRQPLDRVLAALREHLETLEQLMEGAPFLTGEALAACDLAAFGPLRAMAIETHPETAALVRASGGVMAWLRRVDRATTGEHTVPFEG